MQKFFAVLFLISFLFGLITPTITSADLTGPIGSCTPKHDIGTLKTGETACKTGVGVVGPPGATTTWGLCCALDAIHSIADIAFNVLLALGILIMIAGAYYFLTAGAEPSKVQKGQNYILYGVIGLVIALLSKAIIALITSLFTP